MSVMVVTKVNALPAQLVADALYLVKSGTPGLFDFYAVDSEGLTARRISTQAETINGVIYSGNTEPPANSTHKLWWHDEELVLYVKHVVGEEVLWIENTPNIAIPEFAGTGVANTMARSDHNHDETYAKIGTNQW
jgi:hypothetical protein